MHVRAKLRQFLREDEVEKPADPKSWFLIRSEHDIQLATQEILEIFEGETQSSKRFSRMIKVK